MKRSAQRLWLRSAISKCPVHERICFLGLVLFSAVARAIWNSLVKSAGDRRLTMVMIRFTGSCWPCGPPVRGLAISGKLEVAIPHGWRSVRLLCAASSFLRPR